MTEQAAGPSPPSGRGWRRAAGLAAVAFSLSVFTPAVLVAVPVLLLLVRGASQRGPSVLLVTVMTILGVISAIVTLAALAGWAEPGGPSLLALTISGLVVATCVLLVVAWWRGRGGSDAVMLSAALLAMVVAISGPRDGLWYVERAWALLLGGCFLAATLVWPRWPASRRALASVAAAAVSAAACFGVLGAEAWASVDWAVGSSMSTDVAATLQWLSLLSEGQAISPALAATLYEWVDRQILIFPAFLAIASIAALGLAWWITVRVIDGSDEGLGPLGGFRFNDHLVWVVITGLVLLLGRWSEATTRVGWNAAVFMSGLYALRGAAVVTALGSGPSLIGAALLVVLFVLAAPVVLGAAVVIGIGDTWLDFRAHSREPAA